MMIQAISKEHRFSSLEQAIANLLAAYHRASDPIFAEAAALLREEIELRKIGRSTLVMRTRIAPASSA